MRLVAWNANFNNRRRSLTDTVTLAEPLCFDVLVLSEAAAPNGFDAKRAQWIGGEGPGLAVIVRDGLELMAHPENARAPRLAGGFSVRGSVDFELVAAWPVQAKGDPSYHRTLMEILKVFGSTLGSGRAILAGDLNSSMRVLSQSSTHTRFVTAAAALGLVSAYHEQTGEQHGEETVPTYRRGSGEGGGFHIDYCFIPKSLAPSANASVLRAGDRPARRDHFPLVVDIPDVAFK